MPEITEKKTKRKLQAATAAPMQLGLPPVDTQAAMERIMDKLFELALEGNLTAAKLYLDFRSKRETGNPDTLTTEEAIRLLQTSESSV